MKKNNSKALAGSATAFFKSISLKTWLIAAICTAIVAIGIAVGISLSRHTHTFGEWSVTKAATCTEPGIQTRTCKCQETEQESIPALGHAEVIDPAVASTCTSTGLTEGKHCATCGAITVSQQTVDYSHTFPKTYLIDETHHWKECTGCNVIGQKAAHSLDKNGVCTACITPITDTPGVIYDVSADGTYAEVIGYTGSAIAIKIASDYDGLPVKNIYSSAFENKNIKSAIIPDSIVSIGSRAFYSCTSLESVTIGNSVISIGSSAFQYCSSLKNITIPDSVTSIGGSAFSECSQLTDVHIGYGITDIGGFAFQNCAQLKNVTSINGIPNVGDYTFAGCRLLADIKIADNATAIGKNAFASCWSLTSITIPDSVVKIGNEAFQECRNLISVTIGNKVESIPYRSFAGCESLTTVTLGDGLMIIDEVAFDGCPKILYNEYENCIYLGSDTNPFLALMETVGDNYTSYKIHDDAQLIAGGAFSNCTRVAKITIPGNLKAIGKWAFSGCSSLAEIVISNGLSHIGAFSFVYSYNLEKIVFHGTKAEWDLINKEQKWNCLYRNDGSFPSKTIILECDNDIYEIVFVTVTGA